MLAWARCLYVSSYRRLRRQLARLRPRTPGGSRRRPEREVDRGTLCPGPHGYADLLTDLAGEVRQVGDGERVELHQAALVFSFELEHRPGGEHLARLGIGLRGDGQSGTHDSGESQHRSALLVVGDLVHPGLLDIGA